MMIAVIAALAVMMFAAKPIGYFVDRRPNIKMLSLSFLILIGFASIAEGFKVHIYKGYIYFAMAFSFCRESAEYSLRTKKKAYY